MKAEPRLPLEPSPREFHLRGGHLWLSSPFFSASHADRLLDALWREVRWTRHFVHIAGKRMPSPRLSAWYGESGARYSYSGQTYEPAPFFPALSEVRRAVEGAVGFPFNSVLLNAYRDGADSMGWHSDAEAELGPRPIIASVSLGATRRFRMKHRTADVAPVEIDLEHGSLLVMDDDTQSHWRHAVPKTKRKVGLRVNLTFRRVQELGAQ